MHTSNLLDLFPPELIPFILIYLPKQDLKNTRNINNIWEREANLEWTKRKEFLFGRIVQGNYTVLTLARYIERGLTIRQSQGHSRFARRVSAGHERREFV